MQNKNKQQQKKKQAPVSKSRRQRRQQVKNGASAGQKVAKREGARGVDPRVAKTEVNLVEAGKLFVNSADPSIDQPVTFNNHAMYSLSMGIVLTSLKRGWLAQTVAVPNAPYLALGYLYNAFYNVTQGTYPTIQSAPHWFWAMCDALYPKTRPYMTGDIAYSWFGSEMQDPPAAQIYYNNDVTRSLFWGYVGGTAAIGDVNGMPVLNSVPYDANAAAIVIQTLFEFYRDEKMTHRSGQKDTILKDDTSAFAAVYAEVGNVSSGVGGVLTMLQAERFINCPILAKFVPYGLEGRGWSESRASCGTACYILPRMIEFETESILTNKVRPIFKYYNFDEFFEVLSLTLAKAMELGDEENINKFNSATCPLTPQQVQIILRQNLLPVFSNEFAQDLIYSGTNLIDLCPLSVGPNGMSVTKPQMLLPSGLVENIRAVARRVINVNSKSAKEEQDTLPLLGRFPAIPQLGNYLFGASDDSLVYTPAPEEEYEIDLIDCSTEVDGNPYYVTLSGKKIDDWTSDWNHWIAHIANNLMPLATIGDEDGIRVLSTSYLTRHVRYAPPPVQVNAVPVPSLQGGKGTVGSPLVKKDKEKDKEKPHRSVGYKGSAKLVRAAPDVDSDYFKNYKVAATTSIAKFLSPAWKYQSLFVLPVNTADTGGFIGDATISEYQTNAKETYKITETVLDGAANSDLASSDVSPTLLDKHMLFADIMVKSSLASQNEMAQDFIELGKLGDGGLFTSLAGMFLEDGLGIRGAKAAANCVGQVTGW